MDGRPEAACSSLSIDQVTLVKVMDHFDEGVEVGSHWELRVGIVPDFTVHDIGSFVLPELKTKKSTTRVTCNWE